MRKKNSRKKSKKPKEKGLPASKAIQIIAKLAASKWLQDQANNEPAGGTNDNTKYK